MKSFRSERQRLALAQRFFPVAAVGLESLASDGRDRLVFGPEGSKCGGTLRAMLLAQGLDLVATDSVVRW